MDPEVARVVLTVIATIGAIVWLSGLRFLIASVGGRKTGQPQADEQNLAEGRQGWLCGSAEVEGEASTLVSRAATMLAKGGLAGFTPVKILEKTNDSIRFERVEVGIGHQAPAQWFRQGELRFTPLGSGRTRVEWAAEPAILPVLAWVGGVFLVFGLVALVVGYWAISTYVVTSPEPAVRWQTIQMVQAVHFLWEPFLFGALCRKGRRAVVGQFETLANNLPYYDG